MRKIVAVLAIVAVSVATFLVVRSVTRHPAAGTPEDGIEVRFTNLPEIVASQRRVLEELTEDYAPKISGGIDNLTVPAPGLLGQLPGVARVELLLAPEAPAKRLVQLQDWHFVPRDDYVAEVRNLSSGTLTKTQVDLRWQEFLSQVELVQLEQMATLRCLINHHGLNRVYIERLTQEQLPSFQDKIKFLSEAANFQGQLRAQHKEVQALANRLAAEGQVGSAKHKEAKLIEWETAKLLEEHQFALFDNGAAGRLLVSGELEEVLPLDDAQALDAAKPRIADGKFVPDPAKLAARHDAMVKLALAKDQTVVIVAGGSHDLRECIRSYASGDCEYIRAASAGYLKFSGEK